MPTLMGCAALSVFWMGDAFGFSLEQGRTIAFTVLALSPLFHAFNCRSRSRSIFSNKFGNRALWLAVGVSGTAQLIALLVPPLYPVFHTTALGPTEWALAIGLAALPVPIFEAIKIVRRAKASRAAPAAG